MDQSSIPYLLRLWLFLATFGYAPKTHAGCPSENPANRNAGETWDEEVEDVLGEHRFSLPESYDAEEPMPLLLYFHGWGGDVDECGAFCSEAQSRGFATIALQGIASADDESRSWHGFGSTNSSTEYLKNAYDWTDVSGCDETAQASENGRTCNLDAYAVECTDDCNEECLDNCWWTTCQDSVAQTLGVLRYFMEQFCIDETMIWATGSSNGGMFMYELAHDERTSSLLAGVAPMIGLPHYGFNFGPLHNMSFFGSWGLIDDVVPPEENPSDLGCQLPCRTSESEGWFFTSSKCTTEKWAKELGLDNYEDVGDFGYDDNESCWSYSSSSTPTEVVGCHFNGGHYGDHADYQMIPILDFMQSHPKIDSIQTIVPTTSPSDLASTLEPSSAIELSLGSPSGVTLMTPSPMDEQASSEPTTNIVLSNAPSASLSELPTSMEPSSTLSSIAPSSEQLDVSSNSPSAMEPSTTLSSLAPSSQQLEVASTIGLSTTRPSIGIVSSETTTPPSSQFPTLNAVSNATKSMETSPSARTTFLAGKSLLLLMLLTFSTSVS